jgi:hypothetical protein
VRTRRENHLPDRKTGKKKKGKKKGKKKFEMRNKRLFRFATTGGCDWFRVSLETIATRVKPRQSTSQTTRASKTKGEKKEMKKAKRKKKGKMHKLREGKRTAHVVEIALDLLDLRVELVDFFLHRFRFTHGFAFFSLVQKNPVNRVDLDHTT